MREGMLAKSMGLGRTEQQGGWQQRPMGKMGTRRGCVEELQAWRRWRLSGWVRMWGLSLGAAAGMLTATGWGQKTMAGPPTDTSVQASPIKPLGKVPVVDASAQASPIGKGRLGGPSIQPETAVPVRLSEAIDSGRLHNGDSVAAVLSAPVPEAGTGCVGRVKAAGNAGCAGTVLPEGTPVTLTVVATVPAGKLAAAGEFSLQAVRVGDVVVFTNVQTFRGKPGPQDLPDSAPAVGTDAGLPAGAPLMFTVQPPPTFDAPQEKGESGPGSVDGVAPGLPPPAGAGQMGAAGGGKTPAQNLGSPAVSPSQPGKPMGIGSPPMR